MYTFCKKTFFKVGAAIPNGQMELLLINYVVMFHLAQFPKCRIQELHVDWKEEKGGGEGVNGGS